MGLAGHQCWRDLLFLHWPVSREALRPGDVEAAPSMGRIYCVSASPSARRSGAARSSRDQSIQNEQHDRSHDGHRKSHRIALAIPTGRTTDESTEQRARNAEKNGDDEAAGVAPGGEELGDDADDQAEDDPSEDDHICLP